MSKSKLDERIQTFESLTKEFAKVLPPHVEIKRWMRVARTYLREKADVAVETQSASLWAELQKCGKDGLFLDGKEAGMSKFKDKAKYMPMTQGILKLIRNSGELASISPQVVYENDEFDSWTDEDGDHVKFRRLRKGDRGKRQLAFCVAKTKDGGVYIDEMDAAEVEKVRKCSRNSDDNRNPWQTWTDEMWKKTVIKRIAKRLPMSTDLGDVLARDNDLIDFDKLVKDKPDVEETGKKESKTKPKRAAAAVGASKKEEEKETADLVNDELEAAQSEDPI